MRLRMSVRSFGHSVLMVLLLAAALSLGAPRTALGATASPEGESMAGRLITLYASDIDADTFVAPTVQPRLQAAEAATFNITYDADFPPAAQTAFTYAANLWASALDSTITIDVIANWEPLGAGVLGSAGPASFSRNFAGAPQANTWYPAALADALAGVDINSATTEEIEANFSSTFPNWYFGTDGNTPAGDYDFVSVILHELGHGLGFVGSMNVSAGSGSWGAGTTSPFIYDRFTEDNGGTSLLNTGTYPNPSASLASALQSGNVFWDGTNANAANGGARPELYAPATWDSGSSYSHLDETVFPAGNANSLMTPQLGTAEAIHDPGPITFGMFEDMGWTGPLAATLGGFSATGMEDHILIAWDTVSEMGNTGFNLYRSTAPDAEGTLLNSALIPSEAPNSPEGFSYEWEDTTAAAGTTYYYWLEDVDTAGRATRHGPVSASINVPTAVTVSGLDAGSASSLAWAALALLLVMGAALGFARRARAH